MTCYQERSHTDTRNLPNPRTNDGLVLGARASYRVPRSGAQRC